MLRNTASSPPIISIISSDGLRFIIPAKAAEYSVLLKTALERWSFEYLSQPSTTNNNNDDDDDDDNDDDDDDDDKHSEPYICEETTEHNSDMLEQSEMDSSSCCTSSPSMENDSVVNRGLIPMQQTNAPFPTPVRGLSPKDEVGSHVGRVVDSVASDNGGGTFREWNDDRGGTDAGRKPNFGAEHEPFTPPHSITLDDSGGDLHSVEKKNRETREPPGDSRATGENPPSYFSAQPRLKEGENCIKGVWNADVSSGEGLEKDHTPTVVVIEESHTDPEDAEGWFGAAPTEGPGSSLVETPSEGCEAFEDNRKDAQKTRYNSYTPLLNSANQGTMSDNRSSSQNEWKSPASVHQRTPVMLEEDDKVIIMGSDGQKQTLYSLRQLSTSPCAGAAEKPCHEICDNGYEVAAKNDYVDTCCENSDINGDAHEMNEQSHSIHVDVDGRSGPLSASGEVVFPSGGENHADMQDDTTVDLGDIFNRAHITAGEILIDLRPLPLYGENWANTTSGLSGLSSSITNSNSYRQSASQNASHSADPVTCKEEVAGGAASLSNLNGGTAHAKKGASHAPKVPTKALQLCVDYLLHFAQASQDPMMHLHEDAPTVLPTPLTAPICSLLSPWEQNFLYVSILGYDGGALKAMAMLDTILPDGIDYLCPGIALANKNVRDALAMRPPRAGGIRTLTQVRKVAQELRIDSLHELCLAWMADFMIRASYGTSNNFEAAQLIRQCFGIQNEWTRKEMDCLRIENDWPANEEEC